MSWGYDANTHSTEGLSAMYLYDHGQNLVSDLSLHRRRDNVRKLFITIDSLAQGCWQLSQTDARPIIFVAHSLGGIVLKSVSIVFSDPAIRPNKDRRSFTPTLRDLVIYIITDLSRRLRTVLCSWVLLTKEARG